MNDLVGHALQQYIAREPEWEKILKHTRAPNVRLSVVKNDPDDDRVLECAVAGEAQFIVTGDRHLLTIRKFNSIEILPVREFLGILAATLKNE